MYFFEHIVCSRCRKALKIPFDSVFMMYVELAFIIIGVCAIDVYWIAGSYLTLS